MSRRQLSLSLICVMTVVLCFGATARAGFEELLARVPAMANTIVLVDMQALLDSPAAKKAGWREKYEEAYAAGIASISPEATRAVLAAHLDPSSLQPAWFVVLFELDREPNMLTVARTYHGTPDEINGTKAVILPHNAYVVQFGPRVAGAMAPANRQTVARWLRDTDHEGFDHLAAPLKGAIQQIEQGAQIVMVLDTQDAIPAEMVRQRIGTAKALEGQRYDVEALSKLVASMNSISMNVTVVDKPRGVASMRFGEDASMLNTYGKELFLEALDNRGMHLDDLQEWVGSAKGTEFDMVGELTADGLRRILSLVEHPVASLSMAPPEPPQPSEVSADQAQQNQTSATLKYFKSVQTLMNDLKGKTKDSKTIGLIGVWFGKYADKVDALPMLDVDPTMLDFSQSVSQRFREAQAAIQGIGIQSGAAKAQIYGATYSWGSTSYGGYYHENVDPERRAAGAQARANGVTEARGIVQSIQEDTAKVRREMTQKYQVEF